MWEPGHTGCTVRPRFGQGSVPGVVIELSALCRQPGRRVCFPERLPVPVPQPAGLFTAMPISLVWVRLFFLFPKTGVLTCNDAIFLQGLLQADLERCVQNLYET